MVHTYATQNCSFLCMYLINLCMYVTYSTCVTLLSVTCSLITDMILMNYSNNFFKAYFHYYTFQDILITKFTYIQLYNYLCIHMKKQEVGLALTWLYQIILWTLRFIQITWYTFVPNPCDGYYIYVCFCLTQSDSNGSTKWSCWHHKQ